MEFKSGFTSKEIYPVNFVATGWIFDKDAANKIRIATFTLPRNHANLKVACQEHTRHHVLLLAPPLCNNLWEVRNTTEFKRVFLDCVESHYHAYYAGCILHHDVSGKRIMVSHGPDSVGVLNDFDMATERLPDENDAQVNAAHRRTGTLPFMALELVNSHETKPVHLYRHDLESFFYILIWAATHYDFESQTKRKTPAMMRDLLDPNTAAYVKLDIIAGLHLHAVLTPLVLAPFKELWQTWVVPLSMLFCRAHQQRMICIREDSPLDNTTVNGKITFETFMAAIGETPRGLDPNLEGDISK